MYQKLIVWCSLLVVAISPLAGQSAERYAPTEKSLLWKISGKELAKPSYLFGTIHMIPQEHYSLSEAAISALAASDKVAFEIDTEDMNDPMLMFSMMDKMRMRGDTSLRDLLTDTEYAEVSDHFNKLGLPLVLMGRLKPMFLSVFASEDLGKLQMGQSDKIKSYEIELTKLAQQQDKDIVGLETMDFQLSLFDSIPYRAQASMLVESIRGGQDTTDQAGYEVMVSLYKNQDLAGMQQLMEEDKTMAGFGDVLLTQRNQAWIKPMQQLMGQGTVFFAVGAGHLAGEEGVIGLLRRVGYTVQPIR